MENLTEEVVSTAELLQKEMHTHIDNVKTQFPHLEYKDIQMSWLLVKLAQYEVLFDKLISR